MRLHTVLATAALAVAVAVPLAAVTPAHAAPPGKQVAGPAGVRLVKPPPSIECNPAQIVAGAKLTAKARHAGVRSVRVKIGTYKRTWSAKQLRRLKTGKARFACGQTVVVRYTVARAGRKPLVKSFRVQIADAPQIDDGQSGGEVPEGQAPPGAQQSDPGDPNATWSVFVDPRTAGARAGQVCAQVTNTAGGTRWGTDSYCGDQRLDAFFVRTQVLRDTTHGVERLVLGGVADAAKVRSVSATGPDGTRSLALSPPQGRPMSGGGFIAVWDASVPVEQITLTVTYTDGTSSTHPAPASVNVRSSAGDRLD